MNWLERLSRNVGLMIHHVRHPEDPSKQRLGKTVEEKRLGDGVTLRRTTIDEIELRPAPRTGDDAGAD